MRRLWTRALLLGAVGLAATSSAGCAQERDPVNRVQPNALAKSFFAGEDLQSTADDPEFYFQTTLVDVGYGAMQDGLFTSTYAQPMSRVKWVITEDLLIARITYERINDSDGKGAGPASNDGVVAAAYPITGHFDIRRDYNPATGEESNIVVENSSDRPWNQRAFFRVDWSTNLATDAYDFDTLSLIGVYGGVKYEPLAYYVNDPYDYDAPHFDPDNGYFDVTNKAFATPGLVDLSSYGWGIDTFPACYLPGEIAGGTAPAGSCNPVELTLRQAFKRVGTPVKVVADGEEKIEFRSTDFEPKDWDGLRFQSFGGFYEDRYGYARNYGIVDKKWHRLLDHYNIWERSHYYDDLENQEGPVECYVPLSECADGHCVGTPWGEDPNRDVLPENADGTKGDGTADECAAVGKGSQCDSLTQKCTLPYQQRVEKPIVWYYTEGSNPVYFEGTEWAAHEWDVAMRAAVTTAKYAECVRIAGPGAPNDCAGRYPVLRSQQDSNWDLIQLAKEVDDCRHKVPDAFGKPVYDGQNCESLADSIGAQRGYEPEVIELAKKPEMVILCHSPVQATDPEACAPSDKRLPADMSAADCFEARKDRDTETMDICAKALSVRIGDLRYNQVNSMVAPQTPSPWGIYVDAEDPLTGEKVSASINVWTHVNELFSQGIVDQARYIKGEILTEEITEGTYVKDWAAAAEAAGSKGSLGQLTKAEVEKRVRSASGKKFDLEAEQAEGMSAGGIEKVELNPELLDKMKTKLQEIKTIRADAGAASVNAPLYAARRAALTGTDVEAEIMKSKAIQEYSGIQGLPISFEGDTDGLLNVASPLRGANRSLERQIDRMKQNALGQRGACILSAEDAYSPAPLALANLADVLQEKFGAFNPSDTKDVQQDRAEKMRHFIAQRAQYAVIIHEMGHSIALRHNFVSSSDAFNYRSQYWQLRTKNGAVKTNCTDLSDDGEGCVGPRYYDPITDNERKNLMWMFMQSSVMDYAGEITQDLIGLGAYDFASARMFYGDTVTVFEGDDWKVGTAKGRAAIEKVDTFGGLLGWDPQIGNAKGTSSSSIGYYQMQDKYSLINNCVEVADPGIYKPASWDDTKYGAFHPVLDGLIVSVDGKYSKCRAPRVDYVPWNSQRKPKMGTTAEAGEFYRGGPSVDLLGRTRVPYGFATDSWADLGNSAVYRHDNGADLYELFDFFITQQEAGHIFDNYRRGRTSFNIRSAAGRTLGRYNEKMRDSAKGVGLLVNIYKEFGVEINANQTDIVDLALSQFFTANTLASGIAFDHFARMNARPEPGPHYRMGSDPTLHAADYFYATLPSTPDVVLPNGASGFYGNVSFGAMPIENALSDANGEFDRDYTINVGSYYGKMYTTMLLTESEDNFISDSLKDFNDARYRSISIADVFTEGYRRWLANNLTNDEQIKGVRIPANASGDPLTDAKGFLNGPMGTTSWFPQTGPEVCFPNANSIVCSQYGSPDSDPFNPQAIPNVAIVDPLVGWEQQKFLIVWTYVYLPENQKRYWLDRLELKEKGISGEPDWAAYTELHFPNGSTYVARNFGTEVIFGKTVAKGIAARVAQYANELLSKSYQGQWFNKDGPIADQANPAANDWFIADIDPNDGLPIVQFDPELLPLNSSGNPLPNGIPGCSKVPGDNLDCACEANHHCLALDNYKSIPWLLARMDSWIKVGAKGLYPESL